MKTILKKLFILSITLFALSFAKAQTNVIKANPIGFVYGIANVSYERAFADNQSIAFSGSYFNSGEVQDVSAVTAIGANITYNYYLLSDNAPKGLYIGPGVGMFSVSDGSAKKSVLTVTGKVGYQWILWDHFAVDLYGQYVYLTKDTFPGLGRSIIAPGLSIGYAW